MGPCDLRIMSLKKSKLLVRCDFIMGTCIHSKKVLKPSRLKKVQIHLPRELQPPFNEGYNYQKQWQKKSSKACTVMIQGEMMAKFLARS